MAAGDVATVAFSRLRVAESAVNLTYVRRIFSMDFPLANSSINLSR